MDLNESILETQQKCENLQRSLQKLEASNNAKDQGDPPSGRRDVLLAKLSQLEVENSLQKEAAFVSPLKQRLAVRTLLLQELQQTIDQSKKLIQICNTRCGALNKNFEEKENLILQQNQLHEAMHRRLVELQSSRPSKTDENEFVTSYNKELANKKKNGEKQRRDIKKQMDSFINKHFPQSAENRIRRSVGEETFLPLNHIIDDLISLALNKPENPYLSLGSQHWEQYIELLLSYGLATRHPSDINKVKLSDMHI